MKTWAILGILALVGTVAAGCDSEDGTTTDATSDATSCTVDLNAIAWYGDNSEGQAEAVGTKAANEFGVYDLLGNAVEWVSDCYHGTYDGAPTDGSSWDETDCEYRVIRGGCYGSTARGIRVSVRDGVQGSFYGACAPGVRCVLDSDTAADTSKITLDWVTIPGGTYSMGCSVGDDECYDTELPAHEVTVASFQMMAKEATQQEYYDQTGLDPSKYYCPECAVTYVTWDEAVSFCDQIGGRLPTGAEWERAARAGSTGPYPCLAE